MMWRVRLFFAGALLLVWLGALRASSMATETAVAASTPVPANTVVQPVATPTLRPTSTPETVISRVIRVAPTPLPQPTRATDGRNLKVSVVDFGYDPPVVRVPVGGRVTWTSHGSEGHDVLVTTGDYWSSGPLLPEQSFSFVFQEAGAYDYTCSYHSDMRGRVVVGP